MARIIWSDDALQDLDEISEYISLDSPDDAKKFIRAIFSKVNKLSKFPFLGRLVPEKNKKYLRELIHKNYRVIYKVKQDVVEILIVIHGTRIIQFDEKC
jgi:addiction module RelE/StbE family toxin